MRDLLITFVICSLFSLCVLSLLLIYLFCLSLSLSLDFDLGTHIHSLCLSLSLSFSDFDYKFLYFGFCKCSARPFTPKCQSAFVSIVNIILYNYPCHRFWESSFTDFKQFSKCVKLFHFTKLVLYAWSRASQLANSSARSKLDAYICHIDVCMYVYVRSQLKNHRNRT